MRRSARRYARYARCTTSDAMRFDAVRVLLLAALMGGCSSGGGEASPDQSDNNVVSAAPLFTPPEKPHPARFPIVFVHAFNASSTNDWSFNGVKEALAKDGHYVVLADVPPFAGTPARAAELVKVIDAARADFCRDVHPDQDSGACGAATKVNLIGHSQGGLDARYAASKLRNHRQSRWVRALTREPLKAARDGRRSRAAPGAT